MLPYLCQFCLIAILFVDFEIKIFVVMHALSFRAICFEVNTCTVISTNARHGGNEKFWESTFICFSISATGNFSGGSLLGQRQALSEVPQGVRPGSRRILKII